MNGHLAVVRNVEGEMRALTKVIQKIYFTSR